jgi:hypothetical protein
MHAWLCERLEAHGCKLDTATRDRWLAMDIDLNAQGLAVWLDRIARA